MKIYDVINKFFGDKKTVYYNAEDVIHDEHYIKYELITDGRVIIFIGCNNGEVPIGVFSDPPILLKVLNSIIHGWYLIYLNIPLDKEENNEGK